MKSKLSPLAAFAIFSAASGYMPPEMLTGPTRQPKKGQDENDLERIAKAQAKRERKAKRGW